MTAGSRIEMPGFSLCMGNQAQVKDNTSVFSTSTRNFNNSLSNGAKVQLGSTELKGFCAQLRRIPSPANFNQIDGFEDNGRVVSNEDETKVLANAR